MTENAQTENAQTGNAQTGNAQTGNVQTGPGSILAAEAAPAPLAEVSRTQEQQAASPAASAESYDDLVLPEGLEVDPAILADFKDLAARNGLSSQTAQDLVAFQTRIEEQNVRNRLETVAAWAQEAKSDPEYGGLNFERNCGVARAAAQAYCSNELLSILNQTGLGNHPEIVRLFYRMGKDVQEDGRIAAGPSRSGDRLAALYPTMTPSKE